MFTIAGDQITVRYLKVGTTKKNLISCKKKM